ncbi:RNA polymerase II-associated protein [Ephemerocybe angulata]|uniref:RNA polymerase II-associated protein n=1 Tax=Ephemerocybe angulata TaxID=980116 RepID=A0A8H6ICZ3_9AGAR|nr:RNA polymerase II-associated protein [Tulosesus angulatus]
MDEITSGRSVDIELGGQEVISIDLDILDPNPDDVLDLLKEGQCKIWVWTKLAGEYWRRGNLDAAERIAQAAIDSFTNSSTTPQLPPIYALFANIRMARARKAPKVVLSDAQQDKLAGEHTKEDYYKEAVQYLNSSINAGEMPGSLSFLTRGIQQLATSALDDALRSFEGVLAGQPTNLVALLGKGRVLYAKRQYKEALKVFQDVLRYSPDCRPDPRIGIGLCLWSLDHKAKAKAAWQRSLEVNPGEWAAQLLLGLESINASKAEGISEEAKSQSFLAGTKLIERAFQANQKNASAANALCELFIRKGQTARALKLAERTIQFADTLTVFTEGYLRAGRVSHAEGNIAHATRCYQTALSGQPRNVVAAIGTAQMQMQNDEMAAAIHTLDTFMKFPNQRSTEATIVLASLRAYPRPGVSSSDLADEKKIARDLYDRALKGLEIDDARHGPSKASRTITDDIDMHIEIARLWQGENIERVSKAYKDALRISEGVSEASGGVDPRLINNIGALAHLEGHLAEATALYEAALTKAADINFIQKAGLQSNVEAMSTSMLYNLARVYEDKGEVDLAKGAYDKLLSRHPEYIDAKIRQAQMLASLNKVNEAHDLLKQCLTSHPGNLNLRAVYAHFLMQNARPHDLRIFKDFIFNTLKDHDKYDIYSLTAAGWVHFFQARENRDKTQKASEERKKNFIKSAEFYDKVLSYDPMCAYAAQGLAIITAEDALGTLYGVLHGPPADEGQKRSKNVREALEIFAKVRESINDGSVYINMGHCYWAMDEFDRSIESYETASTKFYQDKDAGVLLYLCRSWYSKAIKEQSLAAMNTALRYTEQAYHLHPSDKIPLYNTAMIQQKAAEMLFSLPPAKRTLKDLQRVIDQATHAQKLFASLAIDKSPNCPRRKYGDIMLRKANEHLVAQRHHEAEQLARIEAGRRKREDEKKRTEEAERAKREEERLEAEKLAEERRIAREQALEWTREAKMDSDEERERRPKKARKPKEVVSGDEGEPERETKKKRRGKLRRASSDQGDEEPPMFSEDEEAVEKPTKKRTAKKRVVRDDDEEGDGNGPRKRQYKSKEVLSDTDDEMS